MSTDVSLLLIDTGGADVFQHGATDDDEISLLNEEPVDKTNLRVRYSPELSVEHVVIELSANRVTSTQTGKVISAEVVIDLEWTGVVILHQFLGFLLQQKED
jgi:hypothetical protein